MGEYISIALSCLSMLGAMVLWAVNLKVKHEILTNNDRLSKQISEVKEKLERESLSRHENVVRELAALKEKMSDKMEDLDHDLTELKSNLADRILNIVNGKYVRTDLHQQTIAGIHERFVSFKQLIEVSMDKIEQGLDRQILDLKDRISQAK